MAGLFVVRDVGGLLTFTWWWIRAGHKQSIKTKNFQQGYFWNNRVTWVIQFIAAFVEGSTHQRSDSALPQTFYCKFVLLVFLTEFYFEHANLTEITKRKELKNIKFSYIFLSAGRVCLKRSRMKFILFLFLPPFSNVIIYTSILWIQPWLDLSSDGVLWDTLLMQFSNLISFKRGKHFCHQNIITVWLPDSDPYDPCILIFAS